MTVLCLSLDDLTTAHTEEWARCVAENDDLTPFHGRGWLESWAAAYDARQAAAILVHEVGGRVRALLPLMRWQGGLRSLSYNATDYTGLVWRHEARASAVAFAEWLVGSARTQAITLWNVSSTDPLIAALAARDRLRLVGRTPVSSIRLSRSRLRPWRQLSPISARELRRKRDRLTSAGATITFVPTVSDETIDEFMRVHTAGWNARGAPGSFADLRRVAFVRMLAASGLPLLFATMWVEDRVVSYRFGPVDERTYYDWNTGTDPRFARYTPGLVLLDQLVERMTISERVMRVDFLRGAEDYKRAWQTETTWVSEYRVVA